MSETGTLALAAPPDTARLLAPLGMRAMRLLVGIQQAEAEGDGKRLVALWQESGDALANAGRIDAALTAWERGVAAAEGAAGGRRLGASLYWRLGQVAEGRRELELADGWYERAADAFHAERDVADEAVARMALARVRFHHAGAGLARATAREAVLLAREADDLPIVAEAMELSSAIALDLGDFEEAMSTARDAVRHYRALHDDAGFVRSTIALAEAMLESGLIVQAANVMEPIEPRLDTIESAETRGRGLALMARFQLEVGNGDGAAEPLKLAQDLLAAAGATLRRARLLVAVGRNVERRAGGNPRAAIELYRSAYDLVRVEGDRFRLAPIAYSYARALYATGDHIQADAVIDLALKLTQEAGDLEGLAHCTELGVRIAVALDQGPLALDRMILLARTRSRLGDTKGELRMLIGALEATLRVPDLDPAPLAQEFMECVRRTGTEHLGPTEALALAKRLADAGRPMLASELATIEGLKLEHAGQRSQAARAFAQAAFWALAAGNEAEGLAGYERALALGEPLVLPEVPMWRTERQILLDGG